MAASRAVEGHFLLQEPKFLYTSLSVDDPDHNHDQQRNRECVRYFTLHHNRLTIELVTALKP